MNNFDMQLSNKYSRRYKKAPKKEKSKILDEYCSLTKVSRNTAVQRLRRANKPSTKRSKNKKRGRKKTYIQIHKNVIEKCWKLSGHLCTELMFPELDSYLTSLRNTGKLKDISEVNYKICKEISLGTLKNVISEFPNPNKRNYKSKSHVYQLVPIDANFRKYTSEPGNFEIDYVEHSGTQSAGRFALTGTYVDLFSQWTVRAAGWGKNLKSVSGICSIVLERIRHRILRFHPDNCPSTLKMLTSEAVVHSRLKNVKVSRSRPYKKNDNAHVEQKNGDKVRKQVGHWRLDTQRAVNLLNEFYAVEDLICNFFTPCMKLHCKVRDEKGRVVKKTYQKPATPYDRLMRSRKIERATKRKLMDIKLSLNLVKLRSKSDEILDKLRDEIH
ncbi:hypothetical protein GF357_02350 [Candidatus Dojkabacteria bacterium]|nr:hypothetical protein [Candidatus Dojkabacteria bacterium]